MNDVRLMNFKLPGFIKQPAYNAIWRYLVWFHNRVNVVTSPTPTAVKLLVDHGLTATSHPISNGIDTVVFKPGLSTAKLTKRFNLPNEPILLYLGRTDGEKRIDLIIKAVPLIRKKLPVHLVIAGFGNHLEELKKLTKSLKVTQHVTFTGFLKESDKPALYNACTSFIIASPAELQSIVTLEAMSCQKPVLSVDVAALHELCHDGENGYLFRFDDPADIATKAIKLLGHAATVVRFGKASRRLVEQHHSTEQTFLAYINAYQEALGRTTPAKRAKRAAIR